MMTRQRGARQEQAAVEREEANRLCRSCRRTCRQPAAVVIASCPRYYPGPRGMERAWRQLPLPLERG